jgi:hypothetical protein
MAGMTLMAVGFSIMAIVQVMCLWALWWVTTEVKAMQKSTHSVQFMPADSAFQKVTEQVKEEMNRDIFENLA